MDPRPGDLPVKRTRKPEPNFNSSQLSRFHALVATKGPDDCWFWKGRVNKNGYGQFRVGPKYYVHVLARYLATGEWPANLQTCHSCDSRYPTGFVTYRCCCNPTHLWLGTPAENSRDMVKKGRQAFGNRHSSRLYPERTAKGEKNHLARLNNEQVIEIRELHALGTKPGYLKARFQVSHQTIWRIVNRKAWTHLP